MAAHAVLGHPAQALVPCGLPEGLKLLPPPVGEQVQPAVVFRQGGPVAGSGELRCLPKGGIRVEFCGLCAVDGPLDMVAVHEKQPQTLRHGKPTVLQKGQGHLAALLQNGHDLAVVLLRLAPGDLLRDPGHGGLQDQPGRLRAAQLQTQLQKIAVVMAQTGELLADGAQGLVALLRLDAAQAVHAPHGAAARHIAQVRFPLLVIEVLPQGIAQRALHGAITGGGGGIHLDLPLVAAAVRAAVCDAGKSIIIRRITKLHSFLLDFSLYYTALFPKNLRTITSLFAIIPAFLQIIVAYLQKICYDGPKSND